MKDLERYFFERLCDGKKTYAARLGNEKVLFWDGAVGYLQNAKMCSLNPDAFCNLSLAMIGNVLHMFEVVKIGIGKDCNIEKYYQFRRLESVEIDNELYSVIKTRTSVRHVISRRLLKCVFGNMGNGTEKCLYNIYADATPTGRVLFASEYTDAKYIIIPIPPRGCEEKVWH